MSQQGGQVGIQHQALVLHTVPFFALFGMVVPNPPRNPSPHPLAQVGSLFSPRMPGMSCSGIQHHLTSWTAGYGPSLFRARGTRCGK